MPKNVIIVKHLDWVNTEDDFEQGEVGEQFRVLHKSNVGTYPSFRAMAEALSNEFGLPEYKEGEDTWAIFPDEKGRIDVQFHVNEHNYLPSPEEIEAWKRGEEKMWSAYVVIHVAVGSIHEPGRHELKELTGLSEV